MSWARAFAFWFRRWSPTRFRSIARPLIPISRPGIFEPCVLKAPSKRPSMSAYAETPTRPLRSPSLRNHSW